MYEYIYRPTCIGDNPKFCCHPSIFLSYVPFSEYWVHISHTIPELICHYGCLAVFVFLCQFMGKIESHI